MILGGVIANITKPNVTSLIILTIFIIIDVLCIRSICKTSKPKNNTEYDIEQNNNSIKKELKNPNDIQCKSEQFNNFLKNEPQNNKTIYKLETPVEILNDIKQYYPQSDVSNLLRIISDCTNLIQNSNNIDTVMNRLELVCQKSYTLKQLEQCGKYNGKPTSNDLLSVFIGNRDVIICNALKRNLDDVLQKASNLKTESGVLNRIRKYFSNLEKYNIDFSDNVKNYIIKLKEVTEL